ncbi:hypothetical protein HF086_006698, partial [Spodoptera exigua]
RPSRQQYNNSLSERFPKPEGFENIVSIKIEKNIFLCLKKICVSQLSENLIHTIERDAFLELNALERLRLNNNRLGHLPEGLFLRLRHLQRL